MDPYSVTFEMHKASECELRTSIVGKWATLVRQEPVMPIKVALQRISAAEDMLSFERGQRDIVDTMQILKRPAIE